MKKMPYPDNLTVKIKELRKDHTPAEKKFWEVLRKMRPVTGLKFRRQHPVGPYIADFFCQIKKCVIEIDGSSHEGRLHKDAARDAYMEQQGIRVFRFTESDVQKDPASIYETVLRDLGCSRPQPLPEGGE
jgi:very-short-patch-repair endonuclease